jgi:hypothetical protein
LGNLVKNIMIAAFCAATLSACQTGFTYEPIVPNPMQIEMADARCQMMSSSAQQGMIAFGSTSYVAGAQLGNAIGNAIRVDQFMKQCMTLSGWRRVPVQTKPPVKAAIPKEYAKAAATASAVQGKGKFPPKPK